MINEYIAVTLRVDLVGEVDANSPGVMNGRGGVM